MESGRLSAASAAETRRTSFGGSASQAVKLKRTRFDEAIDCNRQLCARSGARTVVEAGERAICDAAVSERIDVATPWPAGQVSIDGPALVWAGERPRQGGRARDAAMSGPATSLQSIAMRPQQRRERGSERVTAGRGPERIARARRPPRRRKSRDVASGLGGCPRAQASSAESIHGCRASEAGAGDFAGELF